MELANRIADAITDLTSQIWDSDARQRLAVWLDEPHHGELAERWLTYMTARDDSDIDRMDEFQLRQPLQDALAGFSASAAGFVGKTNRWFPWR